MAKRDAVNMKKLLKAGLAIQSVLDTPSIRRILSPEDIKKLRAAKRVLVAGSDYDDDDYVVFARSSSRNVPRCAVPPSARCMPSWIDAGS